MTLRPGQQVIWHSRIRTGIILRKRAYVVKLAGRRVLLRLPNGTKSMVRPDRITPR